MLDVKSICTDIICIGRSRILLHLLVTLNKLQRDIGLYHTEPETRDCPLVTTALFLLARCFLRDTVLP